MYKFICQENTYENYDYFETNTFQKVNITGLDKTPKELKLLSNDVFNFDNNTIEIVHSNFRSNQYNPGILDLTISYGKHKGKMLYLCKPDDKRIPFFLIPYNVPYNFDKSIKKLYITFSFLNWEKEFPHGTMTQNLGNINELQNFYEYILYCKSLNISIQQFTKQAKKKIQNRSNEEIIQGIVYKYNIEPIIKKDEFVFSIDSNASNDFDDAMSYSFKENKISIYITNVALIMDTMELWDAFTKRISSIYLPDKRRTMLPTILVDCLCSLRQKENKLCYVLDIFYDEKGNIKNHVFKIAKVYISKNYRYENEDEYKDNKYFKKIAELLGVKKSKEVVTKLMLYFNHYSAKQLAQYKEGIYKSLNHDSKNNDTENEKIPEHLPDHIRQHIFILKNQASNYTLFEDNIYKSSIHKDIDIYIQSTSPIRRLVDILNNIMIMNCFNLYDVSEKGIDFYRYWTKSEQLDFINVSSRAIRKIQSKCRIYNQYQINKELDFDNKYKGYVYDKIKKECDGKYQYMVYVPEIQITTYVTLLQDLDNYSCHNFSLFVFMSEVNEKKKIKLQFCYDSNSTK
jgi:exoribonuclease R